MMLLMTLSIMGSIGGVFFLIILIILSAAVSGSEVAFFSFSPQEEQEVENDDSSAAIRLKELKSQPEKLLATILITNNLVNIAIVVVSDYLLRQWIGEGSYNLMAKNIIGLIGDGWFSQSFIATTISFLITIVLVTFILVLFGEVAPKIYANLNNISFAKSMSFPLKGFTKFFTPLSSILVRWSRKIESRVDAEKWGNNTNSNKEDIDKAIELASLQIDESPEQVDILKGILKFGDVAAKQIMKPRGDVIAVNIETGFKELMDLIKEHGYSRMPVYEEDFDALKGILYVKDLLGYTAENDDFKWQKLIREKVLYVPESKKIDDLLREFQSKRKHMGIVVDEYGGASGIITLEDIMEEVIGDIKDEFDDEEEVEYIKLSDTHYIFEGKTLINDFCRIVSYEQEYFDEVKGDADSLAGLLLELTGFIPRRDKEITFEEFKFKIVSVSKKRIEKINVIINRKK
jgi:gliding motility-associated protein GldE